METPQRKTDPHRDGLGLAGKPHHTRPRHRTLRHTKTRHAGATIQQRGERLLPERDY